MKADKMTPADNPVFLLRGEDDELYMIEEPAMIARLDAKIAELDGMDEEEIGRHLLAIVNPDKYLAPQI